MSDINQNVNINVNANTQDAGQDISRLENNIKTLDGAVNLVGGSIEVLAGSLALTGAVTEEQAERFQTAAVGAIALADGSKRALEGFKILATETKLFTTLQRILNKVLNANPIFLIVGALAAVSAAYIAFRQSQRDTADVVEDTNQQLQDQIDLLNEQATLGADVKLKQLEESAKARNITTKEAIRLERERAEEVVRANNAEKIRLESLRGSQRLDQETLELQIKQAQAKRDDAQAALDLLDKVELLQVKNKEVANQDRTFTEEKIELKKKEIDFNAEVADSGLKLIDAKAAQAATEVQIEQAKSDQIRAINQAEQEYKELLFSEGVDNIQGALAALFGENKAIASANVLIDAAQAGVGIIKNSQTTGPFAIAYQASQFALLAATTIASLRQINSAEPGSAGTPDTPRGGGLPTTGGLGIQTGTGGIPQIPGFSTSGVTNLNAVVLAVVIHLINPPESK